MKVLLFHDCVFDSVLDMVSLVMHKFGTLAGSYQPRLLQIIICVAALSASLLSHREGIQAYYVGLLKSLRQKAISALGSVSS